jgi:archaemetzincin
MKTIGVALLGAIEPIEHRIVEKLRPAVELAFGRALVEGPRLPLVPPRGEEPEGLEVASVLDELASKKPPCHERLLGVTVVDLCSSERKRFLLGDADARRGVAVVSMFRLRDAPDPDARARLAASEAVHELGHTYGLQRCVDPKCVMHAPDALAGAARRSALFCDAHRAEVARRLLSAL